MRHFIRIHLKSIGTIFFISLKAVGQQLGLLFLVSGHTSENSSLGRPIPVNGWGSHKVELLVGL